MTFTALHPVVQALLASLFTWGMTALGAATVLFRKKVNRAFLTTILGFASGVMIAASFWSLLAPAISLSAELNVPAWLPASVGFLAGGAILFGVDKLLPHLHPGAPLSTAEGIPTSWRKSVLLVIAVSLHNIPEGLSVGVAFGAAAAGVNNATLGAAIALAIGIGLQNFPEGMAVSLPLRGEGLSAGKSFWWGQLSGFVEPIAAVLGALAAITLRSLLPYALAFAAGAMIYVVIEELIPEGRKAENAHLCTLGAMAGFVVMMIMDVAFG